MREGILRVQQDARRNVDWNPGAASANSGARVTAPPMIIDNILFAKKLHDARRGTKMSKYEVGRPQARGAWLLVRHPQRLRQTGGVPGPACRGRRAEGSDRRFV